ncbi:hypothetical protein RJ55_03477 [Drechmeria coniospora]|nr:hypothetical protein RJ55_03477 [Drechmeria coniospora]
MKTTTTTIKAKSGAKKTVKFQEGDGDKENVLPKPKAQEPATTGIRSRPARRGGAPSARALGEASRVASESPGSDQMPPLSPRKVTQMRLSRDADVSEDELAMDKADTPVQHMMKNPIKPRPGIISGAENMTDIPSSRSEAMAALNPPGSPRRPQSSPPKDSLKSPAKKMGAVLLPRSAKKPPSFCSNETPSFKTSLLQSAAKRPQSPIKSINFTPAHTAKLQLEQPQSFMKKTMLGSPAKRAMPGFPPLTPTDPSDATALTGSPRMKPLTTATLHIGMVTDKEFYDQTGEDEPIESQMEGLEFSGRLSAVLARSADPVLTENANFDGDKGDEMELANRSAEAVIADDQAERNPIPPTPQSVSRHSCEEEIDDDVALENTAAGMEKSAEVLQSESEFYEPSAGKFTSGFPVAGTGPSTPAPPAGTALETYEPGARVGSLAEQSDAWSGSITTKICSGTVVIRHGTSMAASGLHEPSEGLDGPLMTSTYFEDEMLIHADSVAMKPESSPAATAREEFDSQFIDITTTDEDIIVAQDATSLEPQPTLFDDGLSEASQEYGDENQVPMDSIDTSQHTAPTTPARLTYNGGFSTTTKVPLKPADMSTPGASNVHSRSAPRASSMQHPQYLPNGASTNSFSPRKRKGGRSSAVGLDTLVTGTPSRSELWSGMGNLTRTPRRDLNQALLRGAVVFVDVNTTEGADASCIFIDLLNQMGARCVKSWDWNPNGEANGEASKTVFGITHVVYKDGAKGTLDKVAEAKGIVHCVGVSWVLDCERENCWLDEAPYSIDTAHTRHGTARRRRSIDPNALANLRGANVEREPPQAFGTPPNRRDSSLWMHVLSDRDEEEEEDGDEDGEWPRVILTPVPRTPAPEAVAKYAAELSGTPYGEDDDQLDSSPTKMALLTRTCPPKRNPHPHMGHAIFGGDKDDQVVLRLMAARRKSLQFAPKIGSPLSKHWD